jgi:hypothetical protein
MSLTHVDPHVSEIVMVWIQSGDLLMVWIQISLMKRKNHLVACSLDLVGRVIMLYPNNSCGPLHASWLGLGMYYILASFSSSTLDN